MSPYFSLILPVFNVEEYLERCLRSVLSQSFSDYEIILVDDGSKDSSGAICDAYASKNANIRVIHKKNGGLSSARNAGLEKASGKYIWFVDSDDWIEPGALEQLHKACAVSEPDIVKFGYFRGVGQGRECKGIAKGGSYQGDALERLRRLAFCAGGKYILSAWSHVYRTEFLKEQNLSFVSEREIGSEDYLFNLTALLRAESVVVLTKPLYSYELRSSSLTQQYKPDLPQRYSRLYDLLKKENEGSKGNRDKLIDRFYVWHLIAGTCFPHEYLTITPEHDLTAARKRVCKMLREPEFRQALINSDRTNLRWQRRVQWVAMLMKFEYVFYYLHVIKPSRKKDGN